MFRSTPLNIDFIILRQNTLPFYQTGSTLAQENSRIRHPSATLVSLLFVFLFGSGYLHTKSLVLVSIHRKCPLRKDCAPSYLILGKSESRLTESVSPFPSPPLPPKPYSCSETSCKNIDRRSLMEL